MLNEGDQVIRYSHGAPLRKQKLQARTGFLALWGDFRHGGGGHLTEEFRVHAYVCRRGDTSPRYITTRGAWRLCNVLGVWGGALRLFCLYHAFVSYLHVFACIDVRISCI